MNHSSHRQWEAGADQRHQQADLASTVAAQRIGDDFIQGKLGGGTVNPDSAHQVPELLT